MKIVIPTLGFGKPGGQRVLAELASAWTREGHAVTILSPCTSMSPYYPTLAQVCWITRTGKISDHNSPLDKDARQGGIGVGSALLSLKLALDSYALDADIVLANHALTAWPVAFSRTHAKKFYYIQAYEPEYYALKSGLNNRFLELAARLSYSLPLHQVVNAPIYQRYREIHSELFVPPGIDFSLLYPSKERCSWNDREIVLGCIGRHEIQKGTRYVVEAFQKLRNLGAPVKLSVAFGNLPEDAIDIPGLSVVVPGNDQQLGDYYRSIDILVAPGTVQLGAVHYPVIEAMACGAPVITTGYLPADQTNSWIVPIHDSAEIAATVEHMMKNEDECRKRSEKAMKDVQAFSWPTVSEKMMGAFSRLG